MTVTSAQPRIKRDIRTSWCEFLPKYQKQRAEYEKTVLPDIDAQQRSTKKSKEEKQHWPYVPDVSELKYENFIEQVTDADKNFYPEREVPNRIPKPNTGAHYEVLAIYRIRTKEGNEYLLTKGNIRAHDSIGKPASLFVTFPEQWIKQHFVYKTVVNERTHNYEEQLEGTGTAETIYEVTFSKEAATILFNQRENDLNISFVVKDELGVSPIQVRDVTGSAQKSFSLFRDLTFDQLMSASYIPDAIKEEMRKEAAANNWTGGNVSDFANTGTSKQPSGKGFYK
jgi:hypothetical protein